jgi:hypothetical protein
MRSQIWIAQGRMWIGSGVDPFEERLDPSQLCVD